VLFKDNYSLKDIGNLEKGSVVLMIEPSESFRRHPMHKVIWNDLIGWVDLEQEELQDFKETDDDHATG
jgi:hypothetical protein